MAPVVAKAKAGRRGSMQKPLQEAKNQGGKKEVSLEQKEEELKIGQMWNDIFKDKEKQKDQATAELFWNEVKARLMRRWGTVSKAFRYFDYSGDGSINFLEFSGMLKVLNLSMELRAARNVFAAAADGDTEIDLNELKMIMMTETFRKMQRMSKEYQKKRDCIRQHLQNFLMALSCANRHLRIKAIDRLQRQFTVPFCRNVLEQILLNSKVSNDMMRMPVQQVKVDRADLLRVARNLTGPISPTSVATRIQSYQLPWMVNVFERAGNYSGCQILLIECMMTLVMLSPVNRESDRMAHLKFLFEVYDNDYDGVLSNDQIKSLFAWICRTRSGLDGSMARGYVAHAFQEDLSEQEGQRHYECARWRMLREGHTESTVTWNELWHSIRNQPDVINSLVPGSLLMHWACVQSPISSLRHSQYRALVPQNDFRPTSSSSPTRRMITTPVRERAHLVADPTEFSPMETPRDQVPNLNRCTTPQIGNAFSKNDMWLPAIRPVTPQIAAENFDVRCSTPLTVEESSSSSQRNRKPASGTFGRHAMARGGFGKVAGNSNFAWPEVRLERSSSDRNGRQLESVQFRKDLTERFKKRLRKLGNERLAELSANSCNSSSETVLGLGSTMSKTRASTANEAVAGFGKSASLSLPSLASKGPGASSQIQGGVGLGLPHESTSLVSERGSLRDRDPSLMDSASVIEKLPLRDTLSDQKDMKWGAESLGRYRLLVEAHLQDRSCPHRALFPPAAFDNFGYRCALCETAHSLNPQEH